MKWLICLYNDRRIFFDILHPNKHKKDKLSVSGILSSQFFPKMKNPKHLSILAKIHQHYKMQDVKNIPNHTTTFVQIHSNLLNSSFCYIRKITCACLEDIQHIFDDLKTLPKIHLLTLSYKASYIFYVYHRSKLSKHTNKHYS